jgi:hypothetical protein
MSTAAAHGLTRPLAVPLVTPGGVARETARRKHRMEVIDNHYRDTSELIASVRELTRRLYPNVRLEPSARQTLAQEKAQVVEELWEKEQAALRLLHGPSGPDLFAAPIVAEWSLILGLGTGTLLDMACAPQARAPEWALLHVAATGERGGLGVRVHAPRHHPLVDQPAAWAQVGALVGARVLRRCALRNLDDIGRKRQGWGQSTVGLDALEARQRGVLAFLEDREDTP